METKPEKKAKRFFGSKKSLNISSPELYTFKFTRPAEPRDFGPTGLVYTVYEPITVDEDFKYYNIELTGDPTIDLQIIYGSKDVHNSIGILTRPAEENIAKIKRNHDISLSLCDGTYIINNGRHRIVYLKHYYNNCVQYCDTEEALNTLKQNVTIPVRINKRIENRTINEILIDLKQKYENIIVFKDDVLTDNPELIIILDDILYYVKSYDEIIDFYKRVELGEDVSTYKIIGRKTPTYFDIDKLFSYIYNLVGKEIYNMSYISFIRYLKLKPPIIDGTLIDIEQIPLMKLYMKYLEMTTCYMICKTYDVELPNGTNFSYSEYSKERQIGLYLMQIINQHLEYKDLKWEDIYEILHEDPKLKQYDSDYLKDIAMEYGIRVVLGEQIFTKKKK